LVLWAIVEEIRKLLRIKRGLEAGQPLALLLRENRIWGVRERLIGSAAARVDAPTLEQGLALAARLDRQIKGLGESFDSSAASQLLSVSCAFSLARNGQSAKLPPDPWDGLFGLAMSVALIS
jgi:DNA polymerase-3 subunit delta